MADVGRRGAMKPAGRARGRNDMASYRRGSDRSRVGPPRGLSAIQQMANVSPQIRAALRRGANLSPERRPPDVAALIGKAPTDTSRLGRQFLTNIKRSRHRRAMVNPRGLLLALPLGLGIDGWCICTNYIQIIVGILVVFFVLWCICTITNNRRMIDAEHLADLARAVAIRSQFQDRLPVALGTRRGLSRPQSCLKLQTGLL